MIYNTPHLVGESYLDNVSNYLEQRNAGAELAITDLIKNRKREDVSYFADQKLGVIEFSGPITDIPHYALCEGESLSHQMVREEAKSLIEKGAKVIVMDMDTPGGMAHMAFESARYIRDLADDNDVKLISYVSSKSFSAGMVYSAVAHEVIVNPSAEVGSIGVKVKLRNTNGALKNMGIEDVYITAGENKVPFNSDGNFTEEFLKEVKDSVLELYEEFTDHVAMYRGLTKEQVVSLGANSFSADKGITNGLVDKKMTLEEFKSYLEEITLGEEMASPVTNMFKSKNKGKEMSKDTNVDLSVELAAGIEQAKVLWEEELKQVLAKKDEELASIKAALEAAQTAQKEAKALSRKTELKTLLGDEKGEAKFAQLEHADDATFSLVVETIKESRSATKGADPMFSEMGDQGQEQLSDADLEKKARLAEKERLAKKFAHANK
jgi:ClpP class serine protease